MSKYNRGTVRAVGRGPLATEGTPSGKTHEGGAGYARDARSELFLRATGSFVGEDSFYEGAEVRDDRLRDLVGRARHGRRRVRVAERLPAVAAG
jgi:hypothetical protein